MVHEEGICPSLGRQADKGLKGPGKLRPHDSQAFCSHTASLCGTLLGASRAWASLARAMCDSEPQL